MRRRCVAKTASDQKCSAQKSLLWTVETALKVAEHVEEGTASKSGDVLRNVANSQTLFTAILVVIVSSE